MSWSYTHLDENGTQFRLVLFEKIRSHKKPQKINYELHLKDGREQVDNDGRIILPVLKTQMGGVGSKVSETGDLRKEGLGSGVHLLLLYSCRHD